MKSILGNKFVKLGLLILFISGIIIILSFKNNYLYFGNTEDDLKMDYNIWRSKKYREISNFTYSPDGKGFAFVARGEDGKSFIVKDGIESKIKYYKINKLLYSGDGKGFTFVATGKNGEIFIVKDGDEIVSSLCNPDFYYSLEKIFYLPNSSDLLGVFKCMGYNNYYNLIKNLSSDNDITKDKNAIDIVYSPDGKNFALLTLKDGKEVILKNGNQEIKNDYEDILDINYSGDGKDFIFKAYKDGKIFIVKNGVEILKHEHVDSALSPKVMYSTNKENYAFFKESSYLGGQVLVRNGVETNINPNCGEIVYSNDSKSLSFICNDISSYIMKDGNKIQLKYDGISDLSYSNDGTKFNFIGWFYKKGTDYKYFFVKEGIGFKYKDNIYSYMFSPNGNDFNIINSYKDINDYNCNNNDNDFSDNFVYCKQYRYLTLYRKR